MTTDTALLSNPEPIAPPAPIVPDRIEQLAALDATSPVVALRRAREEVRLATLGSFDALFESSTERSGLTPLEREVAALRVAALQGHTALADQHRERARRRGAPAELLSDVEDRPAFTSDTDRMAQILGFVDLLTLRPAAAQPAHLGALWAVGFEAADIVTLAQLVAFQNYLVRLLNGLASLERAGAAGLTRVETADGDQRLVPGATTVPAVTPGKGQFTALPLDWQAWLPTVDPARADENQLAVLNDSHAAARNSPYYLTLVHNPAVLRERSRLFNAIMYGVDGLPRAERELATVAVSRINGCPYCASVHARLFNQLSKDPDTIERIFAQGVNAALTPRWRAVVDLAVALTANPPIATQVDISHLRAQGLADLEILDAIHAAAIFAWANRLMQTLGEPVPPPA